MQDSTHRAWMREHVVEVCWRELEYESEETDEPPGQR